MHKPHGLIHFTARWAMLAVAAFSLPLVASGQAHYRITGLGNFGTDVLGQSKSSAWRINASGDIVGDSSTYDSAHTPLGCAAFLYHNGVMNQLSNFGTDKSGEGWSHGYGINDAGDVVGQSDIYDASHQFFGHAPFLYHNGTMTRLGNFGTDSAGLENGSAGAINNTGDIVGASYAFDSAHNPLGRAAFLYHNGTMTNLGNFGADKFGQGTSYASNINDAGNLVGYSEVYDGAHNPLGPSAFLYHNGTMTKLDTPDASASSAGAIDVAGNIVGAAGVPDNYPAGAVACLWHNGTVTSLGGFGTDSNGRNSSEANAINQSGDIVGSSLVNYDTTHTRFGTHAFLYHHGHLIDLNTLIPADSGWELNEATGINDKGQICGNGTHNENSEAFVLDPVVPGDFDGDGHADLVWQNPANGQAGLWLMNNLAYVGNLGANLPAPSTDWHVVGTPDYNADGKPGLLWQNSTTGDIGYWQMNKGSVVNAGLLASGVSTDWHIVSTVDLNADGKPDFVWWNAASGQAAVWYMNGTTVQNTALLASGVSGWTLGGAMPHSGDSSVTLLWRSNTNGDLAYWTLNNTALQASGMIAAGVPQAWQAAGVSDLDGDGQPDILWQNSATGEAAIWYMNGTAFVSGSTFAGTSGTTWKLIGSR